MLTWPDFGNEPFQCTESERVAPVAVSWNLALTHAWRRTGRQMTCLR